MAMTVAVRNVRRPKRAVAVRRAPEAASPPIGAVAAAEPDKRMEEAAALPELWTALLQEFSTAGKDVGSPVGPWAYEFGSPAPPSDQLDGLPVQLAHATLLSHRLRLE